MGEIKNTYELLGRFIPFLASFVWMFLLIVSLADNKMRQKQQLKWRFLLFTALFMLGCLLPIVDAYFASASILWGLLMSVVLVWLPVLGYRLVWYMIDAGKVGSYRYGRHYTLPLIYLLFLIVAKISGWAGSFSEQLGYLCLIVSLLFMVCYLLLSLVSIRTYRRALDEKMRKTKNAKRWCRLVTGVALSTTLSPSIILFPQHTTFLFAIYFVLMFAFILVSSHLFYCSVYQEYTPFVPLRKTLVKRSVKPMIRPSKKSNRRIAKVSKNANGRMEMEPLTSERFEAYMDTHKPYLDTSFRMIDLEAALGANRTVISNFVNRTYQMNFNRYINHLRIQEVERLQELPDSGEYALSELIRKAGFNTMRNYTRAVDIENDEYKMRSNGHDI